MKLNLKLRTAAIAFAMFGSVALFSCEEDASIAPQEPSTEVAQAEITLTPKTLATLKLSNGNHAIFKTEIDGIVYEEEGPAEPNQDIVEMSILDRFLHLTDMSVAVPEDLLALEEDQSIVNLARARGTVDLHAGILSAKPHLNHGAKEMASSWCTGHSFFDTDAGGQFYRTYNGYTWGIAGTTVYSSWKAGANKCKTVNLYLVNCSASNKLNTVTSYKNVFGNYVKQDAINVNPSSSRFWSKTYTSKRYRRAFVSGFGSGTFGGYVLFKNY